MAQTIVARTTAQSISETRLIRQVDMEMAELQPNLSPLYTFTTKIAGKSKTVKSPRIEWYEDDLVADWDSNSATTIAANASSTTITVVDGTLWRAGDLGLVPQLASASTLPEVFRVVSVSGNVLTVVRNIGATGLVSIDADCSLMILAPAHEENALPGLPKVTVPSLKTSYTEIFKTFLAFSGTQMASAEYADGGNERKRQQNKAMRELKIAMNRSFMFGKASESTSLGPSGYPIRTTMGFNTVVTTNVYDAGGTLTRKGFEEFARMSFEFNPGETLLLDAAPLIVSAIHDWGNSFLQLKPLEKVLGVDITRVRTGHGLWILSNDVTLKNGVSGKNGMAGWAFSINMDNIQQRVLNGRPLTLKTNVIADGRDGETDEVLGELGLVIKLPRTHAKMYNVTDYQE